MTRATLLKTGLALLVAAGLMPLAAAHECQPGVYSVDPGHRILTCFVNLVCLLIPHTCVPITKDVVAPEIAGIEVLAGAEGLLALP